MVFGRDVVYVYVYIWWVTGMRALIRELAHPVAHFVNGLSAKSFSDYLKMRKFKITTRKPEKQKKLATVRHYDTDTQ